MERTISHKPVVTPRLSAHQLSETHSQASREQMPSTPSSTTPLSSRYSAPLQFSASVSSPMPRFGTSTPCPGCSQSVSPMERGVVPGPHGQRWHSSCLVCGGQQAKGRGGRRVNGQPGCGKQLDSSAKRDTSVGAVWCRDCLVCTRAADAYVIVDPNSVASSPRAAVLPNKLPFIHFAVQGA